MTFSGSNSSVRPVDAAPEGADVVVGFTSHIDARTIGGAVRATADGLSKHLESERAQIVLADAHPASRTPDAAREAIAGAALVAWDHPAPTGFGELPYHGQPARARAVRAVLQTAERLGAQACVLVGGTVDAADPAWIARLVNPVLHEGFDYVSPYHVRRADEGAITKGILYPMFRALYGARLRQPAAGEFGCSARLASHLTAQTFWDADHAPAGIDLWIAAAAVCGGFRACEALSASRVTTRDRSADLSTTLAQIVGALFADLDRRVDVWQRVRGTLPVPAIGSVPSAVAAGRPVDVVPLIDSFRLGYRELREIWVSVLPARTIVELRKLVEVAPDRFRLDDRLWASILYDFAIGYGLRGLPQDHLLRSLTPLYTGWLASFLLQLASAGAPAIEARVEQVCGAFEAEKRHLISRWRWPERIR